jgi:prepilin-type N-terminal cleavage/methylation domain-containing protein
MHHSDKRWRTSGFTLVELLTVLAISTILLVLAVPAIRSLGGASSLAGTGFQVDDFFQSARQNSISKNVLTAAVILTDVSNPDSAYRTMELLELGGTADAPTWTPVSKWEVLPQGIIIDNVLANSSFLTSPATFNPALPTLTYKGKQYQPISGYAYQVFLPNGQLSAAPDPCTLKLAQGFYKGADPVYTNQKGLQAQNYFSFTFNDGTGEAKITRP